MIAAIRELAAKVLGAARDLVRPPVCRSALVELNMTGRGGPLGVVQAACDRRDRHLGKHGGLDVHGARIEWE